MPGLRFDFDKEAADITPAIQMLMQTYTDNMPYPHKFNDALVKCHLTNLDFAVKHNLWQEHVDHEVATLNPILEMIGERMQTKGPDHALYGMYEGNSCNYQLFEKIEVLDCERRFQCPYKEMLEIISVLGTFSITWELSEKFGKVPAEANDFPGFISNRILMPLLNEAMFALYEGVAGVEEIDNVMKLGMRHPMGPLTLADFVGLDTCLAVLNVLHEGFGDPKYRPCPLLVKYVDAGWLGRKTGRGFYKY